MPYTSNKKSTDLETKTPPIDADVVIIGDSADSGRAKGLTWANVKVTLKTYFDTLYQTILVSGTSIKTVNSTSLLGSGDITIPLVTEDQLKTTTINLSAANIIAMRNTPIELLPAPGAGKTIIVDQLIFAFTPGVTQFTGGGVVATTGAYVTNIANAADINGVATKYYAFYELTTTPLVNTNVAITNGTGSFATGNGTAKVFIKYRIITL